MFDSTVLDAIGGWVREFACAGLKCIRRSSVRRMLSVLAPRSLIKIQKESQHEVYAGVGA